MAADTIQARYDTLEMLAGRFDAYGQAQRQMIQGIRQRMDVLRNGGWIGKGSTAFFTEMDDEVLPALQRLAAALDQSHTTTHKIADVLRAAEEEAAQPFRGSAGTPNISVPDSDVSSVRPVIDTLKDLSTIAGWLPIPASILLALGLVGGNSYSGQVLVRAPQLLRDLGISGQQLRKIAGVSEYLTHIKATNIATHIGKVTKSNILLNALISAGKGVIAVADVWEARSAEYASYDLPRNISARTVDAGLALLPVGTGFAGSVGGVLVGAKVGAIAGGTLGSVIPVLGTAVGAVGGGIIGGAFGGLGGDWLGSKVGEGAADLLQNRVGRNRIIDFVDEKIAQPAVEAVNSAAGAIRTWFEPTPLLQAGGSE